MDISKKTSGKRRQEEVEAREENDSEEGDTLSEGDNWVTDTPNRWKIGKQKYDAADKYVRDDNVSKNDERKNSESSIAQITLEDKNELPAAGDPGPSTGLVVKIPLRCLIRQPGGVDGRNQLSSHVSEASTSGLEQDKDVEKGLAMIAESKRKSVCGKKGN